MRTALPRGLSTNSAVLRVECEDAAYGKTLLRKRNISFLTLLQCLTARDLLEADSAITTRFAVLWFSDHPLQTAPSSSFPLMRWLPLIKALLLPLGLHSCAVGLRFTATLDALAHGASSFEVGLMLACISLVPALCAVQAGRWLDRSGPRPPVRAASSPPFRRARRRFSFRAARGSSPSQRSFPRALRPGSPSYSSTRPRSE